jgi:hypothetical protein
LRFILLNLLLFFLFSATLHADHHYNSSFQFLNAIYSPRLKALGGNYPSLWGDLNGILGNPAGLAFMESRQLSVIYSNQLLDLKSGFAGFGYPLNWGSISAGILYFDHGRFEEFDRFAASTGRTFEAQDFAFIATISNYVGSNFAYGLTLKYVNSKIDSYSASAMAIDLGMLFRVAFWSKPSFGITLRNLGKSLDAYYRINESLPTTLGIGLSQPVDPTPFTIHAAFNNLWNRRDGFNNNLYDFSFGLEMSAAEQLTLRMGYNNDLHFNIESPGSKILAGFSAGFGLTLGTHQLDYGYANYAELGAIHHFGLTFVLDQFDKKSNSRKRGKTPKIDYLLPPKNIRLTDDSRSIKISWDKIEGASFNIYAKLLGKIDWTKINKTPIQKNYISLKKPKLAGIYSFIITTVMHQQESVFSGPVTLTID